MRFARRRIVVRVAAAVCVFAAVPAAFVWLGPSDMTGARGSKTASIAATAGAQLAATPAVVSPNLEGEVLTVLLGQAEAVWRASVALFAPPPVAPPAPSRPKTDGGDEGDDND